MVDSAPQTEEQRLDPLRCRNYTLTGGRVSRSAQAKM
jgi:hypothetical protein